MTRQQPIPRPTSQPIPTTLRGPLSNSNSRSLEALQTENMNTLTETEGALSGLRTNNTVSDEADNISVIQSMLATQEAERIAEEARREAEAIATELDLQEEDRQELEKVLKKQAQEDKEAEEAKKVRQQNMTREQRETDDRQVESDREDRLRNRLRESRLGAREDDIVDAVNRNRGNREQAATDRKAGTGTPTDATQPGVTQPGATPQPGVTQPAGTPTPGSTPAPDATPGTPRRIIPPAATTTPAPLE